MRKEENGLTCNLIITVVVLSLVCLCMYGIMGVYGFSLFPDEFGYWASAARIAGYDFSEVASIGSFYSYGYSLILTPLLMIFKDSIICYRAAVVVNLCLQILSFFLMIGIVDRLAKELSKEVRLILSAVAVLYPSWVFYTQMTMSEALLFFLYTLIVYLMIRYLEKPTVLKGIFLALCSVYIYTVHMRTIGVLFSVALMVLLTFIFDAEKRHISQLVVLLVLVLGFYEALNGKELFQNYVYSSGPVDRTYVNDYSGQTGKLFELVSGKGLLKLLVSMAGKLLYLGCASFGTAYIGIWALAKRAIKRDINALFILTASAAQFMVMSIYLLHSADVGEQRLDLFLHGRYFDFAIPLLAVPGIYELLINWKQNVKISVSIITTTLSSVIAIFTCYMNKEAFQDPHGALMIGMSYFLDEDNVHPVKVIMCSLALTILGSMILALIIRLYKSRKNMYVLLVIPVFLIFLGYNACNHFIYIGQSYIYGDMQVADKISELREEGHSEDIILLYEGGLEYVETIQLRLRDEKIKVYYSMDRPESLAEEIPQNAIVLMDFQSQLNEKLSEMYERSWEAGHFIMYYEPKKGDA